MYLSKINTPKTASLNNCMHPGKVNMQKPTIAPLETCMHPGEVNTPKTASLNNYMHPGEIDTPKTASLENVSINVTLCLGGDNLMSKTMVFCVDKSLEMVSTSETQFVLL